VKGWKLLAQELCLLKKINEGARRKHTAMVRKSRIMTRGGKGEMPAKEIAWTILKKRAPFTSSEDGKEPTAGRVGCGTPTTGGRRKPTVRRENLSPCADI